MELLEQARKQLEFQEANNNKMAKSSTPVAGGLLEAASASVRNEIMSPITRSSSESKPSPKKRALTRGKTIGKINSSPTKKSATAKPKHSSKIVTTNKNKVSVISLCSSASSTDSPIKLEKKK